MEWINTTVGEYCPFIYGKSIKKEDQLQVGFPVYGSNGIYAFSAKELVSPYAVIIGRKGSVGKIHLSLDPCWISDTAFYVKYDSLQEAYFSYFLLSTLGLDGMNTDAAVPGLNRENAHRLEIRIPKLEKDRANIVDILMQLEQKIHLNNQINQTLESIAQAIFKSWFIDFEPVKAKIVAKLEGKDPEVAAMCAISGKSETELEQMPEDDFAELQATAALFPDELVESELGEVPRGWEVKPLDKIANYLNGLALQKFRPENENDFLPIVKIAQLKSGRATTEEKASPNIDSKFIIDDGDIVFSWSGSLMVDIWCGGKAALNQHLFKVTSTEYPKWFYFSYTKRHLAEFQHIAQSKAVTMGHIKREHLSQALCVVPCMRLLRVGNNLIGTQLQKQIALRLENNTLIQVRDTLLPKLLSGEIDVSNLIEQDNGFIAGRVA